MVSGSFAVNLEKLDWFASPDLPPGATEQQVRGQGIPTTPTVVLRSPMPSGAGMLFTFVEIPEQVPLTGAYLTLGDVDGEDEVYLNGIQVGRTTGWGVSDSGKPRLYWVSPEVLRAGRNILAIRLRAYGDRRTFAVKSGPLTFQMAGSAGAPREAAVPGDETSSATMVAAIVAADPEASATAVRRKRASFGRFGEFFHDGLPAVGEVSPTRISQRNSTVFDVSLDRVTSVSLAQSGSGREISGWGKRTLVDAVFSGKPLRYSLRSSVLYPGAVVDLQEGDVLQMRARFASPNPIAMQVPGAMLRQVVPGLSKNEELTAYVITEAGKNSTPAVLAASGLSINLIQAPTHVDITLVRSGTRKGPARLYLFFPKGIATFDLSTPPSDMGALISAMAPSAELADELARWMRVGLSVPVSCDEYFRMLTSEKIRVYQVVEHETVGNLSPYRLRPPQVDFIRSHLNYPAEVRSTTSTGVMTFSGELFAEETTAPASGLACTWYDLPIPPMHERGYLALPDQPELMQLLDRWALSDLGSTASLTGVDSLYKSRTQAFQAFSYLSPEKRNRLLADSAAVVPQSFQSRQWHEHIERLSGLKYWWTYYIEGPYFQRFDQDWGNGLSLYGFYNYVKYAGKWDFAAQNWEMVERMLSWFTATDDWEWMRASNGAHGHGTGAGDCQSAAYAAVVAYARLAESCGRQEEYEYGAYLAARAAIFSLNRFVYNPFAEAQGLKPANSIQVGFHEGQGFLSGELDRYPWNVTSTISGNGVQPGNFDLYLRYAPDALRAFEDAFADAYPQWMNGRYQYPGATLYRGNSGYITLPHIYLRARLGENLVLLQEALEQAATNDYLWWLAPPVIAEVMNQRAGGVYVRDWGRSAFLGGSIHRDDKDGKRRHLRLKVHVNQPGDPVEISMPTKPIEFQVNDGPVPLTDSRYEDEVLTIRLRRPGENDILVRY